ncbi:MAG: protein kinase [Planctomycetes bacterium]|nr:protein kinase [Planctomycetota bacterium]MBL7039677.1 protein kinase [Pirellulaceae bacterium]
MTDFKPAPLKDLLETWLAQRLDESSGDERQDVDRDRDTTALLEFLSRADRCAQMLQEAWPVERTGDNSGHETEVQHDKPLADETLTEDRQLLRFDRFELMRLLGRGGMGDVYLAFDTAIRREVALKIPHPALLMQTKTRKRFLQEARAAGRLRHPNIVGVHESGQAGSICFIAMEYCAGPTLSEWLGKRKEPVPLRLAAKIVARLARAMQHAHERGILHRDLKPSNVLLDPVSESERVTGGAFDPSFPFVVRVTDFGLAQMDSEDGKLTQEGCALGTAAYMAPELASGRRDLQGPGTDVHSLGAILYELLTGQAAFQKENVMATLAAVQAEIPTPPRRLRHDACGDLEAICLKSMEKDIQARYASAGDMAEDLVRFLRGAAVLARPISLVGRYVRWAKRRPALAALMLTATLAVVVAFVGVVWHDHRLGKALATAEGMRTRAEQAEAKALQQQYRLTLELYATDIEMAHDAWRAGDLRHAFEQLSRYGRAGSVDGMGDRGRERNPSPSHWAATGATFDPRGWEWFYLWQRVSGEKIERVTQEGAGYYVCYSPDGIAYSPRGDRVASLGKDGVLKLWKPRHGESGIQCSVFSDHPVHDAVMLPGGNELLTISSEALEILSCRTGKSSLVAQVPATDLNYLAVSPVGGRVAAGGPYGKLYVGDLSNGFKAESWNLSTDWNVWGLAFTPDGTRLLANVGREEIRIFDALTGTDEGVFAVEDCYDFVLSPDGRWLAASSLNDIAIWDLKDASPLPRLRGHTSTIRALAFSPDGRLLASSGKDRRVKIWSWADATQRLSIEGGPAVVETLCFSPDGKTLLTSGRQVPLTAWQVATGRKYFPMTEPLEHVLFGPDFGQVIGRTGAGHVWMCLLDREACETGPQSVFQDHAMPFSPATD